jgi:hypothetical protein
LETNAATIMTWHTKDKEGADEALMKSLSHVRTQYKNAIVVHERVVAVIVGFGLRERRIEQILNCRRDETLQIGWQIWNFCCRCEIRDWELRKQIMGGCYSGSKIRQKTEERGGRSGTKYLANRDYQKVAKDIGKSYR